MDHHRIRADPASIPKADSSQNTSAGADEDVVADPGGILGEPIGAQSDIMI